MSFSSGSTPSGTAGSSNPAFGNSARSLNTYPHPFFDLSSEFIPRTVKTMFRWCQYLFLSSSEIATILKKKCSYPLTEIIYKTEDAGLKKIWKDMLENNLDIRQIEYEMGLDYEVYGNAYGSFFFPFDRYLRCVKCDVSRQIDKIKDWQYTQHKFKGTCPSCNLYRELVPEDKKNKNKSRVKFIRWFPQYVSILKNPFSGACTYTYQIPSWQRKSIAKGEKGQNKYLVKDTPLEFLLAIKQGKDVEFNSDNIFHMKAPSVSSYDDSYGIPPLLHIFKHAWLYQTYRRAQEAIAVEHILPLRLLVPNGGPTGTSPHMNTNLADWSSRMQSIIQRWRRDPNAIFTVPFSATVENIGGDAQALNVHQDLAQIRNTIISGLDMPPSLIDGDGNYSGSSITLRMLENSFLTRIRTFEDFINKFVIGQLAPWLDIETLTVKHRDFKMADDIQQKQIAVSLRQTNTISDQTVIEELGFDYEVEQERKKDEEVERNSVMVRQMLAQADAQGQAQVASAKFAAEAQVAQETAMKDAQRASVITDAEKLVSPKANADAQEMATQITQQSPATLGSPGAMSPAVLDSMVDAFLKSTPPELIDSQIMQMKQDPAQAVLALAIDKKMKMNDQMVADMRPQSEQKPMTRNSAMM